MGSAVSSAADCCTSRTRLNEKVATGSSCDWQGQKVESLDQALAKFRERGATFVESASGDACMSQWDGACGLIEALLTGMSRHLSKVRVEPELWAAPNIPASGSCGAGEKVLSLTVRLDPAPLVGVIATRSHLACDVWLDSLVRFTLLSPPSSPEQGPLVIEVQGFFFKIAPEIRPLRWKLARELGDKFDPEHVYEWWLDNIQEAWPINSSKGRRVMEALFGTRSFQMTVPNAIKATTVWALINGVSTSIRALEFSNDSSSVLRVSARRGSPIEPETAEEVEHCDEILRTTLVRDEMAGEIFAASSFNFVRLIHGHSVGQPGASVAKFTKLLSAAHTWGPGTDGWQRFDETWQAVDEKNVLGRTTRENGRLVWHMPSNDF